MAGAWGLIAGAWGPMAGAWGPMAGLSGFASHRCNLHLGAGCQ